MVVFTLLYTFLLHFSHVSTTPRLGCCSKLNFWLLFLAIEKWEAAQRDSSHATQCALGVLAHWGADAGNPCQGWWATRYPCVRMREAVCHCNFCMVSYVLLGIYFQMVKLEELNQNKGTCFGKILCCSNCCVIWFKNVFSCPLVIFFFPSFQFVPCMTYKPNQSLINTWEK